MSIHTAPLEVRAYTTEEEARYVALLADEIVRARVAISHLERMAQSNAMLGEKYASSLAKIWTELDLIANEIHKIDAHSPS